MSIFLDLHKVHIELCICFNSEFIKNVLEYTLCYRAVGVQDCSMAGAHLLKSSKFSNVIDF